MVTFICFKAPVLCNFFFMIYSFIDSFYSLVIFEFSSLSVFLVVDPHYLYMLPCMLFLYQSSIFHFLLVFVLFFDTLLYFVL